MFTDIFDILVFGHRIYAGGKWWVLVKPILKGWKLVCDKEAVLPAPILLVKQSLEDVRYQDILFRKFN